MQCPSCQHACAPGTRFCSQCGTAVARDCRSCGAELEPEARFCSQCGSAAQPAPAASPESETPGYTPRHLRQELLGRRDAMEGERKFVTVMFVDIQGSVEATSQVDSEEWHRVMDRFFSLAGDAIHRFDGTINQYTGDGVMALFGAPMALEDHAVCACDAALALQAGMADLSADVEREFGVGIEARVGLHSGEVVVATIGVELRRDYTAQGRTVGLAARLEGFAGPGEIFVSGETASLAGDRFDFDSLGARPVKGIDVPVAVHVLRGAHEGAHRRPMAASAFVGREHELDLFARERARVRGGVGRVIGLVGDAGLGKSRLVQEWIDRSRREGFACYTAFASGRRGAPAFELIVGLGRSLCGIAPDEEHGRAREIILRRLEELGPEYVPLAALAYDFMTVGEPGDSLPPLDPAARRRQLASILRALLEEVEADGPALLVVEDVHWIDEASLEVLPLLVEHAAARRLLFVFTARPGFNAPWMGSSNYQQIPLDPLAHDHCEGMIRNLIGPDPRTADLQREIGARAAGNPLFVEHSVLALVSNGVLAGAPGAYSLVREPEEIELPPSIRALLSARVDQLGEAAKRVLHVAALIGGEFDRELVEAVAEVADCGAALDELVKLRLVEPRSALPTERYAFHHPLVRETAELTQLRERRRELHGRLAEALLARHGSGPSIHLPAVADHQERAGQPLEAARTLQFYGIWIYRLDPRMAISALHRAQALADGVPDEEGAIDLRLNCRLASAGMGYQSILGPAELALLKDEVQSLAAGSPEAPRILARIYDYYGQSLLHDGRGREGAEWLARAQAMARDQNDRELYFTLASSAAFLWRNVGDSRRARESVEEVIDMPDVEPNWGMGHHANRAPIVVRHHRACTMCDLGEVQEGLAEMQAALDQSVAANEGQSRCWQVADRVWLAEQIGGREGLEEITEEACRWAEECGSDVVRAQMQAAWGALCRWTGRFDEAARSFESSLALSVAAHAQVYMLPQSFAGLAEARMAIGDAAAAHEALDEADAARLQLEAPNQDLRVHVARARVHLADPKGDVEAAGLALSEAEAIAERLGLRVWRPSLRELRAAWADAAGRTEDRDAALREAAEGYAAFGDPVRAAAVAAVALPVLPS